MMELNIWDMIGLYGGVIGGLQMSTNLCTKTLT